MVKRYLGISILVAISICLSANAQTVGLSSLGMCHPKWPCGSMQRAYENSEVLRFGWLENTFGERCRCADTLLQDERPKEVRVHIANGPCLRNKRCGSYEIFHGFEIVSANRDIKKANSRIIPKFLKVIRRLRDRLSKAKGALTCYVSPVLESDFDGRARRILHRITVTHLPFCSVVDNPLRGRCVRGTVCEKHGDNPGLVAPCIADLDGIDANQISVPEYLRKTKACDMSFVWGVGLNCNNSHSSAWVDPRKRNCVQSGADIRALARWLHGGNE